MKKLLSPIVAACIVATTLLILVATNPAKAQSSWQISALTPHLIVATASGSTPVDARSLQIWLSSDFTGTIDGQAITGATATQPLRWDSIGEHPLKAMPFTRTAGTIYISYSL